MYCICFNSMNITELVFVHNAGSHCEGQNKHCIRSIKWLKFQIETMCPTL